MSHPTASRPVADSAKTRRSIRQYAESPVSKEQILEILELAGRAPSAWNIQPWRFLVVTDGEQRLHLSAAAFGQQQVANAPAVVVLYSDMNDALARLSESRHPERPQEDQDKEVQSILEIFGRMSDGEKAAWGRNQANIALGYLLLVLEGYGYGASPMLGFDPAKVKALFYLPSYVEIPALIAFGVPANQGITSYRFDVKSISKII